MKHFFNDTLTIYNSSGKDEYGRDSWSSGVAVSGRFVEKYKLLYNAKGEATNADALIHVPAETDISVGSKVIFSGSTFRVVQLNKPKDQWSVRFIKAYLQTWENS
jgi:hypothetical protein